MNSCYTYFSIRGDFDPDEITAILGLSPFRYRRKGEARENGRGVYECSVWDFGKCEEYCAIVAEQVRRTIAPLKNKVGQLKRIKERYNANLYIEIVPGICAAEISPCLGSDLDIIDFCHEARAEIDIDLYVYDGDGKTE